MIADVLTAPDGGVAPPGGRPGRSPAAPTASPGRTPWDGACERVAAGLSELRTVWGDSPTLAGARLEVRPLGTRDELSVVDPLRTDGVPTLVVYLAGTSALLGPLGNSDDVPGCPRCLARRWQSVQGVAVREAIELGHRTMATGEPPVDHAAALAALALLIASRDPADRALVHRLDLHTLQVQAVSLLPDPWCPSCGSIADDSEAAAVPAFEPSPKWPDGSFRQRSLEDFELPTRALVNPVCGVIGRGIAAELDLPSTAAIWGCFATRTPDDMYEIYWGGHASSYDASVRIGVLEGLERYASMSPRAKRVAVRGSLSSLEAQGRALVDPRRCGLYSDEFYRDTDQLQHFTPDLEIPWVWGYSLRDRRPVLVPEVVAYYHSTAPEQRFVQECSNGCASGGSLVEAVYCGLMELIERDAFLLSWYGKVRLPEIDPRTSRRPSTRLMVERLALYGYRARFFDARISFGVPVVVGAAQRRDGGLGALCVGAGAGLDPEDALASALVEIATDSMNHRRRTERVEAALREMVDDFEKVLRIHDHPQVFGIPEMARHADFLLDRAADEAPASMVDTFGPPPTDPSIDLRDDLDRCVAELADAGFEVVVVDQTAPEQAPLGLHTASVIVPGLLPLDFGWYRQRALLMPRMRTALREAGLASHDLSDSDLHLVPHPFP